MKKLTRVSKKKRYVVPFIAKAIFFIFAAFMVFGLAGFQIQKRLTLSRLLLENAVQPIMLAGEKAPDFSLAKGNSASTISLKQFARKWLLINFWATWCPPCREEMPSLNKLARHFKDDLAILAISVDEDWDEVEKFFSNTNPSLHLAWDKGQSVSKAYDVTKFPETFLISPQGIAIAKFVGPRDWYSKEVLQYFDKFVRGQSSTFKDFTIALH